MKRLLLLSNSTNPGQPFLEHALPHLGAFLGEPTQIAFVPFAAVRFSYDEFTAKVAARFGELGHTVRSVHDARDPAGMLRDAGAIAVGGGNTFHLLRALAERSLLGPIRESVAGGTPYIGWSAGSNVACPTIRTTNDMPIVEPSSFVALGLIPFQINPHFTDAGVPGHGGETRTERLLEFVAANPTARVLALPEGTMLRVEDGTLTLIGDRPAKIFAQNAAPAEIAPGGSLQGLVA